MNTLLLIILSTFLISLLAFIGVLTLALKRKFLNKILLVLIAFSAGALMGGAFLHLIPEAAEKISAYTVSLYVLFGFVLFFAIEKILHWRHCHDGVCKVHSFSYLNLIGDAFHNFGDGLIIAASFITSPLIGLTSSIAIALHEIPQEIGDFGVLVYGGMKIKKALLLNFLVALTSILGGIIGFFLSSIIEPFSTIILPIAAGGFIYIAASDLVPEIKKETKLKKSLTTFAIFILGILIMLSVKFLHLH